MLPIEARDLAVRLMREHGLAGWGFRFDRARRRFGSCRWTERVITLSRPLVILNSPEQVRDTILHEIAHALAPGDGHGAAWRQKCREVGAMPRRCYTDEEVVSPARGAAPYRMGCRSCEWWVERRRIVRRKYVCAKCRGAVVYEERSM
ncbi:MAG TPA: SprT-like domain-containing protein [Tepidisphaeraceae bacterium]|jgi:predicted SprT family Zn-dependent metalloprotease|nr:SprT-like domain-containing protein [Tepidisphaeraceae bacterium]